MINEFKVKWVSKDYLNSVAIKFLKEYNPHNIIPVPIEHIIEYDLNMDIIPIPGLKDSFGDEGFDIDAFISSDLQSITVEQHTMVKMENRYRFTLAHEIAHKLLHEDIYQKFKFGNLDEWVSIISDMQSLDALKKERDTAEWQADELAGRILVPKAILIDKFDKEQNITIKTYSKDHPDFIIYSDYVDYLDFVIDVTIHSLAQTFIVSDNVVRIRLERDGIIERHK